MENWITLREGAEILGVSHEAIRRLVHRGTIRGRRWAGRIFVHQPEIEQRARAARGAAGGKRR